MPATHVITARLSDPVYQALVGMAKRKGVSIDEVLRDAISLDKGITDHVTDGGEVLFAKGGEIRKLVWG